MKMIFWMFVILLIVGAMAMGYSEGYYNGTHQDRYETGIFLRDFIRATDLETYLKQHGQPDWLGRLTLHQVVGPPTDRQLLQERHRFALFGFIFVAVGLVGLLFTRGRSQPNKSLQATAAAPSSCD